VCVSRLLFGFLLLVVKLSTKESECQDVVLFNCELLLQLGLIQPTGSVENSQWMLPHGVLLFRRMLFARRLVRFNCILLLLCGDILPNPGSLPHRCMENPERRISRNGFIFAIGVTCKHYHATD